MHGTVVVAVACVYRSERLIDRILFLPYLLVGVRHAVANVRPSEVRRPVQLLLDLQIDALPACGNRNDDI
jgi:hypothetical protein